MNTERFRTFIADFTRLVERSGNDEPAMLRQGAELLRELYATTTGFRKARPSRIASITSSTCSIAIRWSVFPS